MKQLFGEFPIVCNVIGKKEGQTVYCDMVEVKITKPGVASANFSVSAPPETTLTVTETYSGANYDLTTENNITYELTDETKNTTYTFEHEYNYKLIESSSLSI